MHRGFLTPADAVCPTSRPTLGEVTEVFRDETTIRLEWTIPDCSLLPEGFHYSPTLLYLNRKWCLGIKMKRNVIVAVCLYRNFLIAGITGDSFRFTIGYKMADGAEGDIVRDQTYPHNHHSWGRHIAQLFETRSQGGVTFTCTLLTNESPHERSVSQETQKEDAHDRNDEHHSEGISRQTQTEGASCSNCGKDEHLNPASRGVNRGTQTEDADGRNDETRSKEMEKIRQKFRLWLQQPQEGGCIRILRREHFQAKKEEKLPEADKDA